MSLLADAAFWVSMATIVVGAYRFSLSQAYKSKCSSLKMCCGLIDVQRNVDIEQQYDIHALEEGKNDESANH